jgi:hypothetical protein
MVYVEQPQMGLKDFKADAEKNGPPTTSATERGNTSGPRDSPAPAQSSLEPSDLERKFWQNVSVSSPPL